MSAGAGQKVTVDHDAHLASTQFLAIIHGGLQDSIHKLSAAGNTLSDPIHWDGRHAAEFRSAWHSAQADLNKIKAALEEFQKKFDTVLKNISTAGNG